ncbi:hypothetical protein EPUL_000760, partial [Erysiphe pulchra]
MRSHLFTLIVKLIVAMSHDFNQPGQIPIVPSAPDILVVDNDFRVPVNVSTKIENVGNISTEANQLQVPRRLPQWLVSLTTRRLKPVAHMSKYNKHIPADYAGSCISVCRFCNALHWPQECVHSSSVANTRFQTCCREGQVKLCDLPEPLHYLKWFWTSEDREVKNFRKNSIPCNRAFAFTSLSYGRDTRLADMGICDGIQNFSIRGQICHQTGATRREGVVPRYAQLYFVDPEEACQTRVERDNLDPEIVRELGSMIERTNPFVQHYRTAYDSFLASHLEGPQRVVIPDEIDSDSRDVILFERDGYGNLSNRFQYINRNHPAHLPLHYVLFFPFGNPGYQFSKRLAFRNQRVLEDVDHSEETIEGYKGHLFSRVDPLTNLSKINALLHGERLFQQICCDMYASIDDNALNWHRQNQYIIRSNLYSDVIDALRRDRPNESIGQPVLLASSYFAGDRYMPKCYQIKLDKLLHDVKERNALGTSIGSIYSFEYQKRRLSHSHLLLHLHLDDSLTTPEQIDEIVRAQIPLDDPELAAIVKSQLTHGPCGPEFPNAPCMRDGKCSKGFPKRFCDETTIREGSYPKYARPDNGVRWGPERFMFDNRWVVPYNPYLTNKYGAHNNVEIAGGRGATSYEDLYTVDGVTYTAPSAACRAWGLTYDDSEWITLYNEVKDSTPAAFLRYQFAVNLADSEILDPQQIWDLFQDNSTDDCLYRIRTMGDSLLLPPDDWSDEERRIDYGLRFL